MASRKAVGLNNINDYLDLDFEELTMLPTAIIEDKSIDGSYFRKISNVFCDECFLLKRKLIDTMRKFSLKALSESQVSKGFTSLSKFYDYASTLWMTLKTSRENLLNFKVIEEILKREKAEEQTAKIIREVSDLMADKITQKINETVAEIERDFKAPWEDKLTDIIELIYLKYNG